MPGEILVGDEREFAAAKIFDRAESRNVLFVLKRAANSKWPMADRGETPLAVNPAADFKALQGQWKVVRQENGDAADSGWLGYFHAAKLDRLFFDQKHLGLVNFEDGENELLIFRVDPTATPKRFEILEQGEKSDWRPLASTNSRAGS